MKKVATSIELKKSTLFIFKSKKSKFGNTLTTTDPTNTSGTTVSTGIFLGKA